MAEATGAADWPVAEAAGGAALAEELEAGDMVGDFVGCRLWLSNREE